MHNSYAYKQQQRLEPEKKGKKNRKYEERQKY